MPGHLKIISRKKNALQKTSLKNLFFKTDSDRHDFCDCVSIPTATQILLVKISCAMDLQKLYIYNRKFLCSAKPTALSNLNQPSTGSFISSLIPNESEPMKSLREVRSQSQTSTDNRRSLSPGSSLLKQ